MYTMQGVNVKYRTKDGGGEAGEKASGLEVVVDWVQVIRDDSSKKVVLISLDRDEVRTAVFRYSCAVACWNYVEKREGRSQCNMGTREKFGYSAYELQIDDGEGSQWIRSSIVGALVTCEKPHVVIDSGCTSRRDKTGSGDTQWPLLQVGYVQPPTYSTYLSPDRKTIMRILGHYISSISSTAFIDQRGLSR